MVNTYNFTGDQLCKLIEGGIYLYIEYMELHNKSKEDASLAAISDTLDGLDAEIELLADGAQFTPSQIVKAS